MYLLAKDFLNVHFNMAEYHKIINDYRSQTNKKKWDNNKKLAKNIKNYPPYKTFKKKLYKKCLKSYISLGVLGGAYWYLINIILMEKDFNFGLLFLVSIIFIASLFLVSITTISILVFHSSVLIDQSDDFEFDELILVIISYVFFLFLYFSVFENSLVNYFSVLDKVGEYKVKTVVETIRKICLFTLSANLVTQWVTKINGNEKTNKHNNKK
ncbi:hypothetical protein PT129_02895 [Erysipelothrix rhusiopathiae]|uniref:hypothetical protein n=1 Tax=Erysipelothrix rhusiopathiae TaxID=1648 RepID=UPI0023B1F5F6|nr:hypothetical protein [Erysipelothrix rhusiopathiae]MDE8227199.1 hypothetical protein [Erysipelothrix rhusiopathiae]